MTARPENSSRHYLITLGVLFVFCLLFMVLFRVEEAPKTEESENVALNLFQMIPNAATKNENIREQIKADRLNVSELAARDALDDPTIMVFPNTKYGFSVVRKENDEPPVPSIEKYDLPLIKVIEPPSERVPLVGIFPEPDIKDPGNFKAPLISKIELSEVNKEIQSRLLWIEDGVEKKSPIKDEDAIKLAAGKVPEFKTEIKIEKLSTSPVLFLVQKCGVPQLDNLVMKNLRSRLLKVFVGEEKESSLPGTVTVEWRLILRANKNP